ncbi:MAG: hypothetical protein WEA77_14540 [Hyphomonas sp.]|uniref:hypothetical protein n=1 Tax=Hyphomonas sp. TaxID=87 RepID=UPI0034A02AA1
MTTSASLNGARKRSPARAWVTLNKVYGVRLEDGRLILLVEDRLVRRTKLRGTLAGEAVQALARAGDVRSGASPRRAAKVVF